MKLRTCDIVRFSIYNCPYIKKCLHTIYSRNKTFQDFTKNLRYFLKDVICIENHRNLTTFKIVAIYKQFLFFLSGRILYSLKHNKLEYNF